MRLKLYSPRPVQCTWHVETETQTENRNPNESAVLSIIVQFIVIRLGHSGSQVKDN